MLECGIEGEVLQYEGNFFINICIRNILLERLFNAEIIALHGVCTKLIVEVRLVKMSINDFSLSFDH